MLPQPNWRFPRILQVGSHSVCFGSDSRRGELQRNRAAYHRLGRPQAAVHLNPPESSPLADSAQACFSLTAAPLNAIVDYLGKL